MIRNAVMVVHSSDAGPEDLWEELAPFFGTGDRCVLYYVTLGGEIQEVRMWPE